MFVIVPLPSCPLALLPHAQSDPSVPQMATKKPPPTATYIVDTFADMILLKGGSIPGRTIRGSVDAIPIPQSFQI